MKRQPAIREPFLQSDAQRRCLFFRLAMAYRVSGAEESHLRATHRTSLIGVERSSYSCSVAAVGRHLVRVGHALLFAVGVGPPHDGVRRARRLNQLNDLVGLSAGRFAAVNEIILPFVLTGTICFTFRANLLCVSASSIPSYRRRTDDRRLLAEAELGFVAPHPVQHDGELARDSDARPRHATVFRDLHAPGAQA